MNSTDNKQRQRKLDILKSKIFLSKNHTVFFSSLMCSLEFIWDESCKTAATDGCTIYWNPEFFDKTPDETNLTILYHELNHVARLHDLRRGNRNHKIWNQACDFRINNDLVKEGYHFKGLDFEVCIDPSIDANGVLSEEQIYDLIIQNAIQIPVSPTGTDDMSTDIKPNPQKAASVIAAVTAATQQAKLAKQAGNLPGNIEAYLNTFLNPEVPWEIELQEFLTEIMETKISWKRPNRRYPDIYLPSRCPDDGRIEHLMYFLDVSGSVSNKDIIRFNSEVKYIQESLLPKRLTLITFDTVIQDVFEYEYEESFEGLKVKGRGGTCLVCVKEYIDTHKPTAAIIFSDLECVPMQEPKEKIPVIWVVNNKKYKPNFGKHIVLTT